MLILRKAFTSSNHETALLGDLISPGNAPTKSRGRKSLGGLGIDTSKGTPGPCGKSAEQEQTCGSDVRTESMVSHGAPISPRVGAITRN